MKANRLRSDRHILAGALISIALLYLATLKNHFVADDWLFASHHGFFETFGYFFKSIIPAEWKSEWLRPVPMFLFWFDTTFWPGTTWGPHLINLLFHLVNCTLIWTLVRHMTAKTVPSTEAQPVIPAITACLVYGLHPLAVGSVGWISARFDVMCVSFGLLGLMLWMRREEGQPMYGGLLAALMILLASLLSKEQGIVFIMACALISLFHLVRPGKAERRPSGLISLLVMLLLYGLFRMILFSGKGGYLYASWGPSLKIPFFYLAALLYPFKNVMPGWGLTWTFMLSVLALITVSLLLWRRSGAAGTTENQQDMALALPVPNSPGSFILWRTAGAGASISRQHPSVAKPDPEAVESFLSWCAPDDDSDVRRAVALEIPDPSFAASFILTATDTADGLADMRYLSPLSSDRPELTSFLQWCRPLDRAGSIGNRYISTAVLIFVTGLLTTAPHSWMTLTGIMGHLESRYATMSLVGFAMLIGLFVGVLNRNGRFRQAIVGVLLVIALAGAWRSDVQIQAWGKAGTIAHSIISQTVETFPEPPRNSTIMYINIPRITDENAYIFGIGLGKALTLSYDRDDIRVLRYTKFGDIKAGLPERDCLFRYDIATGALERLPVGEMGAQWLMEENK